MYDQLCANVIVQNIVYRGCLNCTINFDDFTEYATKYKRFSGIKLRFCKLGTVLLFKTGKFMCVGVKNETDIKSLVTNLLHILISKQYLNTRCTKLDIVNVVASGNLCKTLNLNNFVQTLKDGQFLFNPELFPAVYIYIKGCTVSMFANGKYYITGAKSVTQIHTVNVELIKWI